MRPSALGTVVLPVAVFIIVVAVLAGLVLGGVLHGDAVREGGDGVSVTQPTIVIGE